MKSCCLAFAPKGGNSRQNGKTDLPSREVVMESRIRFATVFIVLGLFILLFLVSLLGMFLSFLIMPGTLGGGADSSFAEGLRLWAVGITATASAITALGAISTAIIGWRGDRR